jgi:hypothetical protein
MVTTWQAILFGVALAYSPAVFLLVFFLWRDNSSAPPPQDRPEIFTRDRAPYCRLRDIVSRINDASLSTPDEIASRIQFINVCKLALVMVGFTVELQRAPTVIEDEPEV